MPRNPSPLKKEAQQLHRQGFGSNEIAEKLEVSRRTVQRWIAEVADSQRKANNNPSVLGNTPDIPLGVREITFADIKDSRLKKIMQDVKFFDSPESVEFNLGLLLWESLAYNRTIVCQTFELLSEELSKGEDLMSLNRVKTFSGVMTKHNDSIEKTSRTFDINWCIQYLHSRGYAVIPEANLKELLDGKEIDTHHTISFES